MADALRLEVITPARQVLNVETESVIVPADHGEVGFLHNHAPLVASLEIGVLRYGKKNGEKEWVAISGGFVEVSDNKVTVLADAAELAKEIDVVRAEAARERAERRLRSREASMEFHRAHTALRKALNRLRVAKGSERE